ncbi:hypothetical protein [Clostridium brassicae]|uniref:Holin n=1 Tax=Clostridium brassicae TaxID=2999072 RepID=A0ABT4DE76_9CLOT|nr:hypothetical protein [Clostridium brassicae]MCY6959511.1 hypothetical protein [Clostridium brassicae]
MIFENFLTIEYVSTFLGTIIVTMLIVQFFKGTPIIKKIPTKYFTFIVALVNMIICGLLTHTFSFSNLYLMIINAMLITFTATGGYDFAIRNVRVDKKDIEEYSEEIVQKVEKKDESFKK